MQILACVGESIPVICNTDNATLSISTNKLDLYPEAVGSYREKCTLTNWILFPSYLFLFLTNYCRYQVSILETVSESCTMICF